MRQMSVILESFEYGPIDVVHGLVASTSESHLTAHMIPQDS